jgi:ABC-type transport system involved in multi-copper enzyme maturation permease subunit
MLDFLFFVGLVGLGLGVIGLLASMLSENLGLFPIAFVGLFVSLLLMLPSIILDEYNKEASFMAACIKDRKEYECIAMWRAGNNHTVVTPIPVIVGR